MIFNAVDAAVQLGLDYSVIDEGGEVLKWNDDHTTSPIDAAVIDTLKNKAIAMQAEYDANQYQRDRATAYPSLADQADMQFHDAVDGTTTWQDAIQAVKDAYPKP